MTVTYDIPCITQQMKIKLPLLFQIAKAQNSMTCISITSGNTETLYSRIILHVKRCALKWININNLISLNQFCLLPVRYWLASNVVVKSVNTAASYSGSLQLRYLSGETGCHGFSYPSRQMGEYYFKPDDDHFFVHISQFTRSFTIHDIDSTLNKPSINESILLMAKK
jgi:hypothetical protein